MLLETDSELRVPLHGLIEARRVTTHFQPIFSVRQKSVVGMEALSRGIGPRGDLIPPYLLFKQAAAEGIAGAVEDLCREAAVGNFSRLQARPPGLLLFLNLDLTSSPKPAAMVAELEALVRAPGLDPRQVAVEFLESRLDDVGRFGELAAALRRLGFLVVLDDVGAGHSNLDRIPLFRPDVIKIDRSLVTGVDGDFYKQETFKSLVSLSRRIGALVIAEGIETEAEAVTVLELGADLLQGFFLGRPAAGGLFDDVGFERAAACVEPLARAFKSHMVEQINARKLEYRRFNGILTRILGELGAARPEDFDAILARVIDEYPKIDCLYVLDDAGLQLTETVCSAGLAVRSGGAMFRPAPRGTDHSFKEYFYVLIDVELQKYTSDPYVSLAGGQLCRTISTCFRDAAGGRTFVLCVDVRA
ncbi:MAG TPA: EAL domain-containing protein [Polyangia bacterium]|nr:EAL domain-containing protein [Polyangia bacterium]